MKPKKRVKKYEDRTDTSYVIKNGILHREDGPALITVWDNGDFSEIWVFDDKIHRFDGQALTTSRGYYAYYVHGKIVTKEVLVWLSEQGYTMETMTDLEKWEFELFMRSL